MIVKGILIVIGLFFMVLLPYLAGIWFVSVVIVFFLKSNKKWKDKASSYLQWAVFPFPLILHPKKRGYVMSWILFLTSPFMVSAVGITTLVYAIYELEKTHYNTPTAVPYHHAEDIKKVTGIDFPEVVPIDSLTESSLGYSNTTVKFIPKEPLTQEFFRTLEKACKEDSCCWRKEDEGYRYYIYLGMYIEEGEGKHQRVVDIEGRLPSDGWVGVYVPLKGDTISVYEGYGH